jgi:hypothetical protein
MKRRYTLRRCQFRDRMGNWSWSVLDNGEYAGKNVYHNCRGCYDLRQGGVSLGRFKTLTQARRFLNQSELERIVAAIG